MELILRVHHKAKAEACQFRRGIIPARGGWEHWGQTSLGTAGAIKGHGMKGRSKWERKLLPNQGRGKPRVGMSSGKLGVQARWSHELKTLTQFLFLKYPRNSTCVGHHFPELERGMSQGEKTGLLEAKQTPLKQGVHTADLQKCLSIKKNVRNGTHTQKKKISRHKCCSLDI